MIYGISDGFARQHALKPGAQPRTPSTETPEERRRELIRYGFHRHELSIRDGALILHSSVSNHTAVI